MMGSARLAERFTGPDGVGKIRQMSGSIGCPRRLVGMVLFYRRLNTYFPHL